MSPRTLISTQISHLKSQLSPTPTAMTTPRPPITCHVLDTTVGLPAQGISVELVVTVPEITIALKGMTNGDGRVTGWTGSGPDLQSVFEKHSGSMACTLKFETLQYWENKGVTPFFPQVEINFTTTGFNGLNASQTKPHWHVPLLLGPFNYTTYRGS